MFFDESNGNRKSNVIHFIVVYILFTVFVYNSLHFLSMIGRQATTHDDSSDGSDSDDSQDSDDQVKLQEQGHVNAIEGDSKRKKPFWGSKHIAYAKGFPFSASNEEIRNFFLNCGEIVALDEVKDDKGKWNGCVKVRFNCESDLGKALTLNTTVWYGSGSDGKRFINVQKLSKKTKKKNRKEAINTNPCKVVVGNLPRETTNSPIRELLSSCGVITSIRVHKDTDGVCRGFAHIEFKDEDSANSALLLDRKLKVNDAVITVRSPFSSTHKEVSSKRNNGKHARGDSGRGGRGGRGRAGRNDASSSSTGQQMNKKSGEKRKYE